VNNYSAEFGRTGGGLMMMTTRSGTNEFHGAFYEFFRNDDLDSRTFFAAQKAPLRYNIFGSSFGGPVIKDRTFFFVNYEGTRRIDGSTIAGTTVPNPAEITGDFSARKDITVLDPVTRQPFPGNIIPSSRIDPAAAALAKFWPAPNLPGSISAAPKNNYLVNVSDTTNRNFLTTRADHSFNANNRVYVRYLRVWGPITLASVYPDKIADSRANSQDNRNSDLVGSWIHNFKPTLLNELRFTYSARFFSSAFPGYGSGENGAIGLTGVDPKAFAGINVTGLSELGLGSGLSTQSPIITSDITDNLTWIRGNHQIKTGFETRYSKNTQINSTSPGGSFTFSDRATGSGLASFLLGWTTSAQEVQSQTLAARTDYYGAFVQDDWKVTPRFTLNFGLRWEMDTPRWDANNHESGFNPYGINPVSGTPGIVTFAGVNGQSKYAHNFDDNNFGPRFGFAYRLAKTFVLRGGFGIPYYGEYDRSVTTSTSLGFGLNESFSSPDGGLTPAFLFRNGVPVLPTQQLSSSFGAVPVGQPVTTAPDFFRPNHVNPYSEQWNFTLQKQLPGNILAEAAYVGNASHKLDGPNENINMIPLVNGRGPTQQSQTARPFPQFGNVAVDSPSWGNSTYNALNLKLEKRYSNGLNFLMNYTWSKFLDDVAALNEFAGGVGTSGYTHIQLRSLDKSLSGNDIPQRFVVSSVYELPFGADRRWKPKNHILDQIAGGWGLGLFAEIRAGAPYGVVEQTNLTNTFSDAQRPNLIRNPDLGGSRSRGQMVAEYMDITAFQAPGVGVFGDAPRNVALGPGAVEVDLSLHKRWRLSERFGLQLRSDFFNLPNRPNFGNPAGLAGRADFGTITALAPGATGRQIQISARFEF
jgi:hypothetical protein